MDWDKLRIFHSVAEKGSLTHAGDVLHLSQSAVSRQIQALEESVGETLFERRTRALLLTESGQVLFRVVQEALTNIRRHAQASHAAIFLQCRGTTVEVLVRDDGVGFDPVGRVDARLGLLGMRERAAAIGGRLEIQSSAAEGTTITLIIPHPLTA